MSICVVVAREQWISAIHKPDLSRLSGFKKHCGLEDVRDLPAFGRLAKRRAILKEIPPLA